MSDKKHGALSLRQHECRRLPGVICGIDEAGRGPLAGPVCAASVVLPERFPVSLLNDSKKLSAAKRESLSLLIYAEAAAWGLGWASHEEIDALNILQASLLAMRRSFDAMTRIFEKREVTLFEDPRRLSGKEGGAEILAALTEVVVDGLYSPFLPDAAPAVPCRPLVKADAQIPAVMAASILAKTARDAEMRRLSALYPAYGYDKHKGYPTAAHYAALAQYGPSPIQRQSFRIRS
jgi:ribonuclease HII